MKNLIRNITLATAVASTLAMASTAQAGSALSLIQQFADPLDDSPTIFEDLNYSFAPSLLAGEADAFYEISNVGFGVANKTTLAAANAINNTTKGSVAAAGATIKGTLSGDVDFAASGFIDTDGNGISLLEYQTQLGSFSGDLVLENVIATMYLADKSTNPAPVANDLGTTTTNFTTGDNGVTGGGGTLAADFDLGDDGFFVINVVDGEAAGFELGLDVRTNPSFPSLDFIPTQAGGTYSPSSIVDIYAQGTIGTVEAPTGFFQGDGNFVANAVPVPAAAAPVFVGMVALGLRRRLKA